MKVSFQGGDWLLFVVALLFFYLLSSLSFWTFSSSATSGTRSQLSLAVTTTGDHVGAEITPLKTVGIPIPCTAKGLLRPNGTGECR